ncbi:conserved hypothetical protein [Burkholderia cenocepacia]|uniref:nucleotide-binding protein n=1 Tax=Burkholderia cenocepacia TaxID=95486 RepID=UPI00192C7E1D|nr:hypothetical protein [Burkholderia cenocepacia]CAD9228008.1 conserved hypothetical protein [Burkholderia cenocepacia]
MSKKVEQVQVEEEDDFDGLLTRRTAAPKKVAIITISDEGGTGKTTSAIGFVTILRKRKKVVDAWQCDPDHMKLLYGFGKRDQAGELIVYEEQEPQDCGYINIRTEGTKLIRSLRDDAEFKVYDLPAASIDELPVIFDSEFKFIDAFVRTGHKIVFVVPFVNDKDSLLAVEKLQALFSGVHPDAVIEFALVLNYQKMVDQKATVAALDSKSIQKLARDHKLHVGHIRTKFVDGFESVIDYTKAGPNRNWFDLLNPKAGQPELSLEHEITMETFLKEYIGFVKEVVGDKF